MTSSTFLFLLFLFAFALTATTAMTRKEALKELRLSSSKATPKAIKAAYRKRSLATHPDKGGSSDEFIRVAQAYDILTNNEQPDSSNSHYQSTGSSGGMSHEDQMKFAEDLFFQMFGEFLENSNDAADSFVDWAFDKLLMNGKSEKLGFGGRQAKRVARWLARRTLNVAKAALESDNTQITINGHSMTGADLRKIRELARKRKETLDYSKDKRSDPRKREF